MGRVVLCLPRIEESLLPWLEKTLAAFVPYLPGPCSPPLAASDLPPPIYRLEPVSDIEAALGSVSIDGDSGPCYADIPDKYRDENPIVSAARARVYHPPGWGWAVLGKNRRVTAQGWFQDVREIELELEDGV